MFTLRVNSFAASFPRVKGIMVLFLFFSFAVSSTMATPCLDHVVWDILRILAEWVVDVSLLQVGLKCFSMRMTIYLLDKLLNAEIFCLFHNCMWQSWHSEVNVYFLELGERLSTQVSLRSCLIYVFVFVFVFCLQVQQTLAHNSGWILVHPQVSPFLSLCFRDQTRHFFRSPGWTNLLVAHHGSHRSW